MTIPQRRAARARGAFIGAWLAWPALRLTVAVLALTVVAGSVRAAEARAGEPPGQRAAHKPAARRAPPRKVSRKQSFSWLNPTTWPVLPVPMIAVDPSNGATLGIMPTMLQADGSGRIVRIIAPDVVHNDYFGTGGDVRWLEYPSTDTRWSVNAGIMQRVDSDFAAMYRTGLLRTRRWSLATALRYTRNGAERFFGIGNATRYCAQSVYTGQRLVLRGTIGWNITHTWQLAYTLLARRVRVSGGHLPGVVSITRRFPSVLGMGTTDELLERLAVVYDTRNSITLPTSGADVTVYYDAASRDWTPGGSMFTAAGADARFYWASTRRLTIAMHVDLRYMLSLHAVPFWALSSIGGDRSILGGRQTLRGFDNSRFYGRDSFVANIEFRQQVLSLNTLGTHVELQIAPFYDVGRVFEHSATFPIDKLHNVLGVGFRGIAPPSIVGYVDIGYGGEGAQVYTGIDYPF